MKLKKKIVSKPWGRTTLPAIFGGERKRKIGEIWFEPPEGITPSLMIKYLFTSEKLSIQVHPNDRHARRAGLPHGKEECWYILDAEPDAVLGVGLTKEVSPAKLRAAIALDEIENLVDWKPVKAGDFFYIPAGTIHAIGPGITLVEAQQNVDVTYRLYDYGRPRELHVEEAMNVASLKPYDMKYYQAIPEDMTSQILDGPKLRLFQVMGNETSEFSGFTASEWQIVPLDGKVKVRGKSVGAGECGLCASFDDIDLSENGKSIIICNMQ